MTPTEKLIVGVLRDHRYWWNRITEPNATEELRHVVTASAATAGLAVALAWVAREYPDRADELTAVVRRYIDNGGADEELLGRYSEAVSS